MSPEKEPQRERYTVRSVMNDPSPETEKAMGRKKAADRTPLEKARKWALEYLKRPHSEAELRKKLREKDCAEEDIDAVCAQCVDYGFLDDREYAGMIVRYYAGGGYGPGRIRTEFARRGVPKELWDEALAEYPESTAAIDRLLAARLRGKDAADRREIQKASAALYRKGYSWEDIRAALARFGQEEDYGD